MGIFAFFRHETEAPPPFPELAECASDFGGGWSSPACIINLVRVPVPFICDIVQR